MGGVVIRGISGISVAGTNEIARFGRFGLFLITV